MVIKTLEFRNGWIASLPISALGLLDGYIFGFLARAYQLTFGEATLMSVLVTSGAAQFLVLPYMGQASAGLLIFLTLLVSIRYLFLGAGIARYFRGKPARQTYPFLFLLFDENWALTLHQARKNSFSLPYFAGAGVSIYLAGVTGTVVGSLFPLGEIANPKSLNLLIYLIFAAILVGQWKGWRSFSLWGVTAVVAVAAERRLAPEWSLIAGTTAGLVMMLILRSFKCQKS